MVSLRAEVLVTGMRATNGRSLFGRTVDGLVRRSPYNIRSEVITDRRLSDTRYEQYAAQALFADVYDPGRLTWSEGLLAKAMKATGGHFSLGGMVDSLVSMKCPAGRSVILTNSGVSAERYLQFLLSSPGPVEITEKRINQREALEIKWGIRARS